MEKLSCDFLVIGSGPAGQKGAIQAAKLGKKVILVEKEPFLGGNCLNSGTIPSKSLRAAIIDLRRYNERAFYGASCLTKVTINDLNYRLQAVLEGERAILGSQLRKNHIKTLHGIARFIDPNLVEVEDPQTKKSFHIHAKKILLATGSEPRNPLHVPFDREVILDSTRLLSISRTPKTMIVLGGGVVGTEYASFFAALGCKVTVLDQKERLLPNLDAEIGIHLQVGLKDSGLELVPRKVAKTIKRVKDHAEVTCEDGSFYKADILLYALGREAKVHMLNLDLAMTELGYIRVNPFFQTSYENIYAAGDVIGYPALASSSMEQGRLAARHAFGVATHPFPSFFPLGIYTIPEISFCGPTEEDLIKQGVTYEVGRAYYYEIAASHITGSSSLGMFKLLFCKNTRKILAVHIVGRSATELIHIGQMAMNFHATIDCFIEQVFNYPTFAEGYRIAAFNGLNKLP